MILSEIVILPPLVNLIIAEPTRGENASDVLNKQTLQVSNPHTIYLSVCLCLSLKLWKIMNSAILDYKSLPLESIPDLKQITHILIFALHNHLIVSLSDSTQ